MKNIAWILPDIHNAGSGGYNSILDHVKDLSELYAQTIYTPSTSKFDIEHLYGALPSNVNVRNKIVKEHDLAIATWWETVKIVCASGAKKRAYFIQDLENLFYPVSDEYFGARESYLQGLIHIARGKYIHRVLQTPYFINFGADTRYYKPLNVEKEKAICFLHQPQKPHRCTKMGLKALKLFKEAHPEYTIYLYGSDITEEQQKAYPEFVNLGLLSFEDCNKLYNICELGICFSPTNPSNIPYEMMAAGSPCLDLDIKNKDDFDDNLLYLTTPNYIDIAMRIEEILKDTLLLDIRRQCGLKFMKERPLTLPFNQMRDIIKEILNDK